MPSLFATLGVSVRALLAEQSALQVTANNVANANTEGYSRQRAILMEGPISLEGPLTFGTGVDFTGVASLRDAILEIRIHQERQQQGAANAFVQSMSQAQVMFSNSSGDIGSQISAFISRLQALSSDPGSLSLRQGVLAAAGNLASAFRTTSQNLTAQRNNLDLSVGQTVNQINVLTAQISDLNAQITTMQNMHEDPNAFIDQRDVLIGKLSDLVDGQSIQSDKGLSLTTSNGTALVAGNASFALDVQLDPSGVQHIFAQGKDITGSITGGALAGYLQVRDQKIPAIQSSLDVLAAGLANGLNTANRNGFDLSGNAGGDLFAPPPASGQGAASAMTVQITDPMLIAASSDGSPGSNGNVAQLLAVHDQDISGGMSPADYYANIVFGIGTDVANGMAEQDASGLVLGQLQDQRGSISGVSLDEEAANLLQYQRAYDAAAKVVTTINDMLEAAVNLGRY
jgi:flagellar hook-associated protein 1 FlgK